LIQPRNIARYANLELTWKRRSVDAYGSPVDDPYCPRSLKCYIEEKTTIVRNVAQQERVSRATLYVVPLPDPPKENDYIYLPCGECVIIKVEPYSKDGVNIEMLIIYVE